jgi:hypothetical protein
MYQDSQSHSGVMFTALLLGAAVGAALGVVLAPRSGAETRRRIATSGEPLRQGATRAYAQASDSVRGLVARGREAMTRRAPEPIEREHLTAVDVAPEGLGRDPLVAGDNPAS